MRLIAKAIGFTNAAQVVFAEVLARPLHERGKRSDFALVGRCGEPATSGQAISGK
jgi:hypothetical protein